MTWWWWGIQASAEIITPMVPAAMFKSAVELPDLVVPGGRVMETRPAPGEGDTVWACWSFSDDPLQCRQPGMEGGMQPCGSKHMKWGYYKVSAGLAQGKGAVEVKQGSLLSCSCLFTQNMAREERAKGGKNKHAVSEPNVWCRVPFQTNMNWLPRAWEDHFWALKLKKYLKCFFTCRKVKICIIVLLLRFSFKFKLLYIPHIRVTMHLQKLNAINFIHCHNLISQLQHWLLLKVFGGMQVGVLNEINESCWCYWETITFTV